MSQQGALQESVRAITGTSLSFNGDLLTLFQQAGAKGEHWNEAALSYFRGLTGAQHISEAMNRFARNNGAYNWGSLGAATWPEQSWDFIDPPLPTAAASTRSSSGWAIDESGALVEYANNEARWDASIGPRGFLSEEEATNEARSPDMSGASVGRVGVDGSLPTGWSFDAQGAFVCDVTATGTEGGWPYIDIHISGFNASGGDLNPGLLWSPTTGITAAQNEWWTSSVYLKRLGDAPLNVWNHVIVQRNAGGSVVGADSQPVVWFSERTRDVFTDQLTAATVANVHSLLQGIIPDQTMCNAIFRIYVPQLEERRFASSPILGPGGPNTRAADLTTGPYGFNNSVGTLFIRASIMHGTAASGFPRVVQLDDNTNNNRVTISTNSSLNDNRLYPAVQTAGAAQIVGATGAVVPLNEPFNAAIAWASGDIAFYVNGVLEDTGTGVNMPTLTNFAIFNTSSGADRQNHNGHMFAFSYWKSRLPNTDLEAMTKTTL